MHSSKLSTKNKKKLYLKNFSFLAGVVDTGDKHSFAIISVNFSKKFEMVLMVYSGARGTLIYEKSLMSKISCQTPFKFAFERHVLAFSIWRVYLMDETVAKVPSDFLPSLQQFSIQ